MINNKMKRKNESNEKEQVKIPKLCAKNDYCIEQWISSDVKYTEITTCTKGNFNISAEKGYTKFELNMRQNGKTNPFTVKIKEYYNPRPLDKCIKLISEHNLNFIELFGTRNPMKEFSEVACGIHYSTGFSTTDDVRCYIIGEGINLCASKLISYLKPHWDIVTIDPLLPKDLHKINNITVLALHDYDVDVADHINFSNIVILGVHSHNNMRKFVEKITMPTLLINLVCCEYPEMDNWYARFCDPAIVGGCNEIFIWRSDESFKPHKKLFYRDDLVEAEDK